MVRDPRKPRSERLQQVQDVTKLLGRNGERRWNSIVSDLGRIDRRCSGQACLLISVCVQCSLVNVISGQVEKVDLAIYDGMVLGWGDYEAQQVIDASDMYVCPGFIDGHIHLESTHAEPGPVLCRRSSLGNHRSRCGSSRDRQRPGLGRHPLFLGSHPKSSPGRLFQPAELCPGFSSGNLRSSSESC